MSVKSKFAQWVDTFGTFSDQERVTALKSLIFICSTEQLSHLHGLIVPQLQRDFISLLPVELSLHILQHLETKDLLIAAQTCRKWSLLCENNSLWRKKCQDEGLFDYKEIGESYKKVYLKQKKLEYNWRYGRFPNDFTAHQQRQMNQEPKLKYKMLSEIVRVDGHSNFITCLQFNPESNIIVSGSEDCSLKVWSSITGECLRTLTGHTRGVRSSLLSRENILISGSVDATIKVWNALNGNCLQTLYGHIATIRCLALNGDHVVSGSRDKTLRVWNIKSASCLQVLVGHSDAIRCVHFNDYIVVSGGHDSCLKLWDFKTGICLQTFIHGDNIYVVQLLEHFIISGSCDSTIRVFATDAKVLKRHLTGHQAPITCLRLGKNVIVSGSMDSTVKVWDLCTGRCLHTLTGVNGHSRTITDLEINAKFIISASNDGKVKLWELKTAEFIRDIVSLPTAEQIWFIHSTGPHLICSTGSHLRAIQSKIYILNFM